MSPQPPPPSGPPASHRIPSAHFGRGERILHIDDEPTVTLALQRLLQKIGYRVEAFNLPEDALNRLRAAPTEFDLILTDLMMPVIDGLAVAAAAQALRPELPVVLLSAFTGAHEEETFRSAGIREIIIKPAGISLIAASLRRVLDSPPATT